MVAAHLHELLARRLDIARFIGATGLQDRLLPVPSPRQPEARVAFRQDRILKMSQLPGPPAINTDLGFRHAATAAPGQPADLLKAGLDLLLPRWGRDHRLRLHHQAELIRLAVRHEIGVFGRLLTRHERSGAELQPPEPLNVDIAFIAGNEESQRKALLRPQRLSVLAIADHGLFKYFMG